MTNKQEKSTGFYSVEYKGQFGGSYKAIVQAESIEEAKRKFYDPDDPVGPRNQIKAIRVAKRIPKTYEVMIEPKRDTLVIVRINKEINLTNWDEKFVGTVKDKVFEFTLKDVVSAMPARKEAVMKKGTRI